MQAIVISRHLLIKSRLEKLREVSELLDDATRFSDGHGKYMHANLLKEIVGKDLEVRGDLVPEEIVYALIEDEGVRGVVASRFFGRELYGNTKKSKKT